MKHWAKSAEASGLRACRGRLLASVPSNLPFPGGGLPSPYPLPVGWGRPAVGRSEQLVPSQAPQDGSKTAPNTPRQLQDGSKTLQDAPRSVQDVPRHPRNAPRHPQDTPKTPSRRPKMPSNFRDVPKVMASLKPERAQRAEVRSEHMPYHTQACTQASI